MMRSIFVIAILLVAAPALAKYSAHACKMPVYSVNAQGQVAEQPIISPEQIVSVRYAGVDPPTGMGIWRIVLSTQGAAVNAKYTKSHLGGKVAVFCGHVSVGQFAIQGSSVNSFVIFSNELGP